MDIHFAEVQMLRHKAHVLTLAAGSNSFAWTPEQHGSFLQVIASGTASMDLTLTRVLPTVTGLSYPSGLGLTVAITNSLNSPGVLTMTWPSQFKFMSVSDADMPNAGYTAMWYGIVLPGVPLTLMQRCVGVSGNSWYTG